MAQPLIVGDIGGTNVRFAVAHKGTIGPCRLSHIWQAPANDFPNFYDALDQFMESIDESQRPGSAVFAMAGPIDFNVVKLTNKSWTIRRENLISQFGFENLIFMNDFAAMARSVPEMSPSAFLSLQDGQAPDIQPLTRVMSVAGAGTGLGQASLITLDGEQWQTIASEGGHQPYAPMTELEFDVLARLRELEGYVSFETICSGKGLAQVHRIICDIYDTIPYAELPRDITTLAKTGDTSCQKACELTANALMNFLGNAVLSNGAWSGAVLAGGVSNHLRDYVGTNTALDHFSNKGKMRNRMKNVPIRLLIDQTAPLIGAASAF